MLTMLQIENVAVIEKASVEFGSGLTVLTGETGAGKSIVIDAVAAVLGGRTSRELIRTGSDSAKITAVFDIGPENEYWKELDVEADVEGLLVLGRKIGSDGKSVCRVNGAVVSVSQLRRIGERLLDIHGQNDGQKLLDETYHGDYLDSFGGLSETLSGYQAVYRGYRDVLREMEKLALDESEKERRMDSLRFQIEELTAAKLVPGEGERLSARRELLKNAARLTDALETALYAMCGGDRADGAVSLIGQAEEAVDGAARYTEDYSELAAGLSDLRFTAEDLAERLREAQNALDFYPGELDELENRLDQLRRLFRKYGDNEEEMLIYLEKCTQELDDIECASDRLMKLERTLDEKRKTVQEAACALSEMRKEAAERLEKRIMSELVHLNMPGVRFSVELTPKGGECGFDSGGSDNICFLMSANAGENPGRISKIASGGELSRIMLALKSVLAENEEIGTMIFDEVDTGVSGIAAQRVGEKLSDLAQKKQVLCVTHLPQIAVMADRHIEIKKEENEGRTHTRLTILDEEGKKRAVARLSGGEVVTEAALFHAGEQITAAGKYKEKTRKSF